MPQYCAKSQAKDSIEKAPRFAHRFGRHSAHCHRRHARSSRHPPLSFRRTLEDVDGRDRPAMTATQMLATSPATAESGGAGPISCCIIVTLQTKSEAAGQTCWECEQRHFSAPALLSMRPSARASMRQNVAKRQQQRALVPVRGRDVTSFAGRFSPRRSAVRRTLDESRASRWNKLRLLTCKEQRNCPPKGNHRPIVKPWGTTCHTVETYWQPQRCRLQRSLRPALPKPPTFRSRPSRRRQKCRSSWSSTTG